ncbi:hypothetical protein P879_11289 [Paragonimus westermani]|uniref:Uncharacterized protein n=1 Tax=Paragonimus westermani TaxID=34504 RepID=A0A8T0DA76_9TREM|nr:hypothetical protein P879_11289 [Paragonimus westermani]
MPFCVGAWDVSSPGRPYPRLFMIVFYFRLYISSFDPLKSNHKCSGSRHKIWKNDGIRFLIISGRHVKLLNEERKTIASTLSYSINYLNSVSEGSLLKVAGYYAELLKILCTTICNRDTDSSVNYIGPTKWIGTHGLVKTDVASMNSLVSICRKTCPDTNRKQTCSISEGLVMPRPPIDCIVRICLLSQGPNVFLLDVSGS